MNIIYIVCLSLFSVAVLFTLTKLMGNKQISQMTTFDYVTGITIGSIAAEMSTGLEDFHKPLTAMVTYGLVAVALSIITNKSIKARQLIDGKSIILFNNGKFYKNNFKKSKMNMGEFLTECRISGYSHIADIQTVVLESNGKISILPKETARALTTGDINICPEQKKLPVTVILDGIVMNDNLKYTGNDDVWLNKQIENQKIKNIKDIFYASCDENNNLSVYTTDKEKPDRSSSYF